MRAMDEITPDDVCSRCGATVRSRSGSDGSLEGGIEIAPLPSSTEGSLEGGIDIAPAWDCDCVDGPQVRDR